MATRRNRIRQRDSEATKRKLLDAVAAIMREQGFSGLKTGEITRWIGKDKNLIRYHFNSLANLQKAYIREKDYWPPFFERFVLTSDSDAVEMETLFIELMKENLRFFHSDGEMQKIILWQISEDNPLIRSISEAREADGAKLLDMTDPFFVGTEVNFRAVIALMLGGVYYMVLQSSSIKSAVCGINVNLEKDRNQVLKTIGQVISWAWKQVASNKMQNLETNTMNYEFELLEKLATQFLQKQATGKRDFPIGVFNQELKRVERVLLQQLLTLRENVQISTFLKVNLYRLVEIADSFYVPGLLDSPEAEGVLALIAGVSSPVIELVPMNLKLPKLFWVKSVALFSKQAFMIEAYLISIELEPLLIRIVLLPFEKFSDKTANKNWHGYRYLKRYLSCILSAMEDQMLERQTVLDLLITLGMNHANATAYLAQLIKAKMEGLSVNEKREVLIREKKQIQQLGIYLVMNFQEHKRSPSEELLSWIDAELGSISEQPLELNPLKLNTRLKAIQLALWQKLQYDHGMYEESNLDVFSEKIAFNFSTKGQDELSAASIKSKLYSKDLAVIDPIEKLLVEMLEDVRRFR